VLLPASYSHIDLPRANDLPGNDRARAWIDAWQPGARLPADAGELHNIVQAADIWHSVKRHWCAQAQRLLKRTAS